MAEAATRKRARAPKVRTGCRTCKSRRLKCDETRPGCLRCRKLGFPCDGYEYPDPRTKPEPTVKRLHPKGISKHAQGAQALIAYSPRASAQFASNNPSFQSENEFRYFKVFRDEAAGEFSGYFDGNMWSRLMLQVCQEEEFARHAIVAIGALHSTMDAVQTYPELSLPFGTRRKYGTPHHEFALQQYGKALKSMRELSHRKSESWFRNTLLSCLLTTCFERFVGNQDNALASAQAGVEILTEKELISESGTPDDMTSLLKNSSLEENGLLGMFARLEATLLMFGGSPRSPRRLFPLREEQSAVYSNIPSRFETIPEAKLCWDLSIRRALQWTESHVARHNTTSLDFGESNVTNKIRKADAFAERLKTELSLWIKAKAQWLHAFQLLFDKCRKDPGSKDFFGASSLMIQYLGAKLTTASPGQNTEGHCDLFLEDHIIMVNLARDCLETYSPTRRPGKTVFIFDGSIVAGLFTVATRCRDCKVRREAIGLLQRNPRREGLWDSAMALKVGTWVMNAEEEGIVKGYVPEAARLRIVKTELKLSERTAILRCSKLVEETGERVDMSDITLTW